MVVEPAICAGCTPPRETAAHVDKLSSTIPLMGDIDIKAETGGGLRKQNQAGCRSKLVGKKKADLVMEQFRRRGRCRLKSPVEGGGTGASYKGETERESEMRREVSRRTKTGNTRENKKTRPLVTEGFDKVAVVQYVCLQSVTLEIES